MCVHPLLNISNYSFFPIFTTDPTDSPSHKAASERCSVGEIELTFKVDTLTTNTTISLVGNVKAPVMV